MLRVTQPKLRTQLESQQLDPLDTARDLTKPDTTRYDMTAAHLRMMPLNTSQVLEKN